jgi:hypothetical protein
MRFQRYVIDHTQLTREEIRFERPNQKSQIINSSKILYTRKSNRQHTPTKQQRPQPQTRPHVTLHNPIAGHFEQKVRQTEQAPPQSHTSYRSCQCLKEIVACLLVQDFAVADVATIEVVEEIYPGAEREDTEIQCSHEAAGTVFVLDMAA